MNENQRDCACNKAYEKAKKRIEEANKNVKYRYIQGPKGDPGPQGERGEPGLRGDPGPTTIQIGITETGEPGTQAEVTNVGTDKDVVLNFKIPKGLPGDTGPKGEMGPIGPQGLPGEIGISEVITIDGTETIEPDELAEVQDDFDRNIHHLTFYIPKGEKGEKGEPGPIGPQGEQGPAMVAAYAVRYQNEAQELNLQTDTETIIPLNQRGPFLLTDYSVDNAIKIKESGFYQISYFFRALTKTDSTLTLSAQDNGLLLPASNVKIVCKANISQIISNTFITALVEDDVLTLNVRANQETDLILEDGTNVVLTIVKVY